METNRILQIALSYFVGRLDKLEQKNWAEYAIMDAAMVRLRNPELPYTDISLRFMRFLIKER